MTRLVIAPKGEPTEWPAIRAAVDKMIGLCRS